MLAVVPPRVAMTCRRASAASPDAEAKATASLFGGAPPSPGADAPRSPGLGGRRLLTPRLTAAGLAADADMVAMVKAEVRKALAAAGAARDFSEHSPPRSPPALSLQPPA